MPLNAPSGGVVAAWGQSATRFQGVTGNRYARKELRVMQDF
jgi:hypothetical protein